MSAPVLRPPYLLFLGSARQALDCKSARGVFEWRPEQCLAEWSLPEATESLGLERLAPIEAAERGAASLLIGTVSAGGALPSDWLPTLEQALGAGLDVVSGMHQRLSDSETLRVAAEAGGSQLIDVRNPDLWSGNRPWTTGTGVKRAGIRVLTVGTDCSAGKMYTALSLERALRGRGADAEFKATGQTGIFIAGTGVPIDAVVSDFVAGAVERLSPDAPGKLHVIEGQGSLHHPAFAGVSLGLLHGAQPDYLVVCHEPTRRHMRHVPHLAPPSIRETIEANLLHARRTNPTVQVLGLSINTKALPDEQALRLLDELSQEHRLPTVDPARTGVDALIEPLL